MDGEAECRLDAQVVEKSYAGGQLRILFMLDDGQRITANRYGIDASFVVGSRVKIGWKEEHGILMKE
jgi:spermidine/putrescine transport system ATP-binding protein